MNNDDKYHFYAIIVKDVDEDVMDYSDAYLANQLNGYTTNEWIFREYLKYYEKLLNQISYVLVEYDNLTDEEFKTRVYSEFKYIITEEDQIEYEIIYLTSDAVYYNTNIGETVNELNAEYESVEEIATTEFYRSFHLFNDFNSYLTGEFDFVLYLLYRLCNAYIPVIKLSECFGLVTDTGSDLMIGLTKAADFPSPLENYEYYDLISYGYILSYYVHEMSTIMMYEDSPPDG